MKNEIKKISKIVDEIINFFLYNYHPKIEMNIEHKDSAFFIDFKFSRIDISDSEFEKIKNKFKLNRREELEDYYWQLAGEAENASELTLVSLMSDNIEFKRTGQDIHLNICRKTEK